MQETKTPASGWRDREAQRRGALKRANELRLEGAALRRRIGTLSGRDARVEVASLLEAVPPEVLSDRVERLLDAIPRLGTGGASQLAVRADLRADGLSLQVRALSVGERTRLAAAIRLDAASTRASRVPLAPQRGFEPGRDTPQRRAARQKANQVRSRRGELRREVRALEGPEAARRLAAVIAEPPEWIATLRVAKLLELVRSTGAMREPGVEQALLRRRFSPTVGELRDSERWLLVRCLRARWRPGDRDPGRARADA